MSLALLFHYLLVNMFRMLIHPSSGACDLFDATVRCLLSKLSQHVSGIVMPIFRRTRRVLLHVVCCAVTSREKVDISCNVFFVG